MGGIREAQAAAGAAVGQSRLEDVRGVLGVQCLSGAELGRGGGQGGCQVV